MSLSSVWSHSMNNGNDGLYSFVNVLQRHHDNLNVLDAHKNKLIDLESESRDIWCSA